MAKIAYSSWVDGINISSSRDQNRGNLYISGPMHRCLAPGVSFAYHAPLQSGFHSLDITSTGSRMEKGQFLIQGTFRCHLISYTRP